MSPDADRLLLLAQTMQATPDSHVLLLGAGISRSAGVRTAWGVQMELIRRLASAGGAELDADEDAPAAWWRERYNVEPRYEDVLEKLGGTPVERQQMLRGFFEPSDAEREEGLKSPTAAHEGIAQLAKLGVVKVIVTLNFDRLVEQALRAVGVEPTILTTPSDVEGVAPLQTIQTLVVHLHGDYLSANSMLNTREEIGEYPQQVNEFLRAIMRDRGLVVVGWSAEYDPALRDLIRSVRRPFSSVWIEPGEFSASARELSTACQIQKVTLDADQGLGRLADAVLALHERRAVHPLSLTEAIGSTKRALSGEAVAVSVHDRIAAECASISAHPDIEQAPQLAQTGGADIADALVRVEAASSLLVGLTAAAALWGNSSTDRWWQAEIERLAQPVRGSGTMAWLQLPAVPALLMHMAAKVASIAGERYDLFFQLMTDGRVPDYFRGGTMGLERYLRPESIYRMPLNQTPSEHVFGVLAPVFRDNLTLNEAGWIDAWETANILAMAHELYVRDVEAEARMAPVARSDDDPPIELLKHLANLVSGHERLHIRAEDLSSWSSVCAHRLIPESRRLGLIAAGGICGGSVRQLRCALQAVNVAVARQAKEMSFRAVGPQGGALPDYMWLDTGKRPDR